MTSNITSEFITITNQPLAVSDIVSIDDYEKIRNLVVPAIMAHKEKRRLVLNENISLYFEDRFTIWYQVQEMVRAERLSTVSAIEEELAAYNPLIPLGSELKATMMIMYETPSVRKVWLARLLGVENLVWLSVGNSGKITAIADEDLDRSDEEKTSSVHFLRFALDNESKEKIKAGDELRVGVDHPAIVINTVIVSPSISQTLASDVT